MVWLSPLQHGWMDERTDTNNWRKRIFLIWMISLSVVKTPWLVSDMPNMIDWGTEFLKYALLMNMCTATLRRSTWDFFPLPLSFKKDFLQLMRPQAMILSELRFLSDLHYFLHSYECVGILIFSFFYDRPQKRRVSRVPCPRQRMMDYTPLQSIWPVSTWLHCGGKWGHL